MLRIAKKKSSSKRKPASRNPKPTPEDDLSTQIDNLPPPPPVGLLKKLKAEREKRKEEWKRLSKEEKLRKKQEARVNKEKEKKLLALEKLQAANDSALDKAMLTEAKIEAQEETQKGTRKHFIKTFLDRISKKHERMHHKRIAFLHDEREKELVKIRRAAEVEHHEQKNIQRHLLARQKPSAVSETALKLQEKKALREIDDAVRIIKAQKLGTFSQAAPKHHKLPTLHPPRDFKKTSIKQIKAEIYDARHALEKLELHEAKHRYHEIILQYQHLEEKQKSEVFEEIRELYDDRKHAEAMFSS